MPSLKVWGRSVHRRVTQGGVLSEILKEVERDEAILQELREHKKKFRNHLKAMNKNPEKFQGSIQRCLDEIERIDQAIASEEERSASKLRVLRENLKQSQGVVARERKKFAA